jgi:type IV secretory pathway VirB3-like protein
MRRGITVVLIGLLLIVTKITFVWLKLALMKSIL